MRTAISSTRAWRGVAGPWSDLAANNFCEPDDYTRGYYHCSIAQSDMRAITLLQRLAEESGGQVDEVALRGHRPSSTRQGAFEPARRWADHSEAEATLAEGGPAHGTYALLFEPEV